MISDVQARQAGLTVQWYTQLNIGVTQRIVDAEVIIDEDDATTYFELRGGGLLEVISDKDLGPNGEPQGIAEAEANAKIRQEVMQAELKFMGSDDPVEMKRFSVPKIAIYALTDNGVVHGIDGETGEVLWRTNIGSRKFPSVGLGASKTHVVAVNGSRVYCLDARSGKVLFEHQCEHAVLSAPAVSEDTVFVPLANGALQALPIGARAFGNLPLNAVGSATTPPIVAGNFVAWTSDAGYLVVAPKQQIKSMRYRIRGAGEFAASPTASQGRLFAVTLNGFIYAIDDVNGQVLWNFAVGDRVTQAPVAIGDSVYIISDENRLFKFNAKTGGPAKGWEKPIDNVSGYAGASASHLYVKDVVGNIVVLDRETGVRVNSVYSRIDFNSLGNTETDRLYLWTSSGMLQCLREIAQRRPFLLADLLEAENETTSKPTEDAAGQEAQPAPSQPKPDSGNPFESGGDKKKADDNPFGTGGGGSDNPFGTGGGNSDNPFGTGGG